MGIEEEDTGSNDTSSETSIVVELEQDKIRTAKNVVGKNINAIAVIKFNGRTISELNKYYSIHISPHMTHIEVQDQMSHLSNLMLELNEQLGSLTLSASLFKNSYTSQRGKRYLEIKKEHSKYTLDQIENQLACEFFDQTNSLSIHEFLVSFFERMQGHLIGSRKMLESYMYSVTSEMRTTGLAR